MAAPKTSAREPAGVVQGAQSLFQQALEKYRLSDRFTKMKAGIFATWTLLAVLSLWIACPSSGPTNPLGADVQVLRDSLVGGEQLLVRNESSAIWTDVKLTIDGTWRHERNTLRPHDQLVLSMGQFRRDGQSAPGDLKPRSLLIECEQGHHTFELK